MKKKFFCIAFVFVFAFAGCDGTGDPLPVTLTGLTDLLIEEGASPGEIRISFTETVPPADSYTLYIVAEIEMNATVIISGSTGIELHPRSAQEPGVIYGFDGDTYSAVVVARKDGFDDLLSTVMRIRPLQNILTVYDIPANTDIIFAAIINNLSLTNPQVVAVGAGARGADRTTFALFELDEAGVLDETRPWRGTGSHFITLSTSEEAGVGDQFIQGTFLPSRQRFPAGPISRNWRQFMANPL